jgi:purine-binding chemotaxis protein CheW
MSVELAELPGAASRVRPGKHLTFILGRESYGVTVQKVREILRLPDITPVPRMPAYFKGVINLRGKIIPVIDLRLKFGLSRADTTDRTCIVVVQGTLPGNSTLQMGMIVDAVEEVLNINAPDIESTPAFALDMDTAPILGLAKIKGAVKTLLDIDQIVSAASVPGPTSATDNA